MNQRKKSEKIESNKFWKAYKLIWKLVQQKHNIWITHFVENLVKIWREMIMCKSTAAKAWFNLCPIHCFDMPLYA